MKTKTMKSIFLSLVLFLSIYSVSFTQDRYYTRNGHIDFFSHAPLEDIEADNEQVAVFLTVGTGEISSAMLMKSFTFVKALMQQHFNENYIESDKFPRSEFEGRIVNFADIDFSGSKTQQVTAKGKITLHGVSKDISLEGTMKLKGGKYHLDAVFILKPEDFEIKIPASLRDNIAKEIRVTLSASLEAM